MVTAELMVTFESVIIDATVICGGLRWKIISGICAIKSVYEAEFAGSVYVNTE
jgi:hypothetical protein